MAKAKATKEDKFCLRAEAACCIWESMLEARSFDQSQPACPAWAKTIPQYFEDYGTGQMRYVAIRLADDCLAVYDALSEEDQQTIIPYDWEFVPTFLSCLDWANANLLDHMTVNRPAVIKSMRKIASEQRERDNAAKYDAPFLDWLARVDRVMKFHYAIDTDEAGEDRDHLRREFATGTSAEDYVRWYGEKYDLTLIEEWNNPFLGKAGRQAARR